MRDRERKKGARPRVSVQDVHRYLWTLVDEQHRVQIFIADIADHFGVAREIIQFALLEMRGTGRIKYVACRQWKRYVYEVYCPNTFNPRVGRTLNRPAEPAWG